MYKELDKYKTDDKIKKATTLIKLDGSVVITNREYDKYVFGLGDLIQDFINHERKPFWKRKYYHRHLTKIYKRVLNELKIIDGI